MKTLQVFEFDKLVDESIANGHRQDCHAVPSHVFNWLRSLCQNEDEQTSKYIRLSQSGRQLAIQFRNYVGVLRAPNGYQIEILPKIGKNSKPNKTRKILIEMLKCLMGFRHVKSQNADLQQEHLPLLEVFIQEFLLATKELVQKGLRKDYVLRRDNLYVLRGKLLMAEHIRQNLVARHQFYTQHDEFSLDRAENRLLCSAVQLALQISRSYQNQRLARELHLVFADITSSRNIGQDIKSIKEDRNMAHYDAALAWAKLLLQGLSPTSLKGTQDAPSLLFPMDALFESFVARHLAKQLKQGYSQKTQARTMRLVRHRAQDWFQMKPDLLIISEQENHLLLDTKWKLVDESLGITSQNYQLSQADFYQMFAYGRHYLQGMGELVLIFPKTDKFTRPLPLFTFAEAKDKTLRLWVLPFCLQTKQLMLPDVEPAAREDFEIFKVLKENLRLQNAA